MKKALLFIAGSLILIYLLLLIPTEEIKIPNLKTEKQFVWNRDSLWLALENQFVKSKQIGCDSLAPFIEINFLQQQALLTRIESFNPGPADSVFQQLEKSIFYTASLVGGCPGYVEPFIKNFTEIRSIIKKCSINWNINDLKARQALYKIIYGGRAAVEELLLQADRSKIPSLVRGEEEESATPSASIFEVKIHSGDILISRGGAPTSALIARGNDYPGNFSHAALVYVDEKSKLPYIIEAHIERGVTVSSLYDYVKDKKLRLLVLRLRSDLPALQKDPMLPHKAAESAYRRAGKEHIPYDFAMDYKDNSKLFCSEVISSPYKKLGINLWMGGSSISAKGAAVWLAGFGVEHFENQAPSDLEYDPQLKVVAEWRDPETLLKDHIDNAVVEALLDKANEGKELKYDWYLLPMARLMKFYSVILNYLGMESPVPEGMSPESALRHKKFVAMHNRVKEVVDKEAKKFLRENNYSAPYWKMVAFAKKAIEKNTL